MELIVDYDPFIKVEAEIVAQIIRYVFGYKVKIRLKQHPELLKYDEERGAYKLTFSENVLNTVYVTGNQVLVNDARSNEEFFFGAAIPKTKTVIISLARLRGLKGEDSSILKISKSQYERRVKHLTVHEIGHWAVQNQDHFDEYVTSIFDSGPHCKDVRCVMYPGNTIDPTRTYRKYFCKTCIRTLLLE